MALRNNKDVGRVGYLGRQGERLAADLLKRRGFSDVEPLPNNHIFADIAARRDGTLYLISVKARNKYEKLRPSERTRRLNARYKLGRANDCLEHAERLAKERNAIPAWVTIAVEDKTYDAYFGTVALLQTPFVGKRKLNGKGVIMTEAYLPHYECLARNEPHDLDPTRFRN